MPYSIRDRLTRGYTPGSDAATLAPPTTAADDHAPAPAPAPDMHAPAAAIAPEPHVPDASGPAPEPASTASTASTAATESDAAPNTRGQGALRVEALAAEARRAQADAPSAVEQLKAELHRRLVDRLDLKALEKLQDEHLLADQVRRGVADFLRAESTPLSTAERESIVEQVVHEVLGLGPIEPLFRDPKVSDILINGAKDIWVEKGGKLSKVATRFRDDAHLMAVIDRIVSRVGRRVDESSPMVDARLPDGSRVNAVIPPLAIDGPVLSIRRFGASITAEQLVGFGAFTNNMLFVLASCVRARLNVLVSGGTGSGKTTLLNALSSFIPDDQRVVTIEDAAELRLQQAHVVRLETRPPNSEGRGEVSARDLVKNALRMRPDRIIVGETRSGEAIDMLQAMNTGHEGSMTTVHANTPRDAISRLEVMVLFSGTNLPTRAVREQIASAVNVVVQVSRQADGTRRVMSITEITGMEGDMISAQEIFRFRRMGLSPEGKVLGKFEASGVRPMFADKLKAAGADLPGYLFETT